MSLLDDKLLCDLEDLLQMLAVHDADEALAVGMASILVIKDLGAPKGANDTAHCANQGMPSAGIPPA